MTRTVLADLIERQVTSSLVTTLGRSAERIAEELATDLLKDPDFRAEMQALVRVAFAKALQSLQEDAAEDGGAP